MRARCVLNEHDANGVVVIHDTRNAGGLILARLHARYSPSTLCVVWRERSRAREICQISNKNMCRRFAHIILRCRDGIFAKFPEPNGPTSHLVVDRSHSQARTLSTLPLRHVVVILNIHSRILKYSSSRSTLLYATLKISYGFEHFTFAWMFFF